MLGAALAERFVAAQVLEQRGEDGLAMASYEALLGEYDAARAAAAARDAVTACRAAAAHATATRDAAARAAAVCSRSEKLALLP